VILAATLVIPAAIRAVIPAAVRACCTVWAAGSVRAASGPAVIRAAIRARTLAAANRLAAATKVASESVRFALASHRTSDRNNLNQHTALPGIRVGRCCFPVVRIAVAGRVVPPGGGMSNDEI